MIRRETLVVILLLTITFAARLLPGPRTIDDAYITFRYARHILAGNGFVYNTGERVLGTTTPLYTLLMTIEAGLSGRRDASTGLAAGFPELALITNAVADCVSVWILYRLGRRLGNGPLVGISLAAIWAIHPVSVTFAVGGMETSVFVALILGTFAAYLDGRWRAAGALAALALLTRPEALIAIALLVGDAILRLRLRIGETPSRQQLARPDMNVRATNQRRINPASPHTVQISTASAPQPRPRGWQRPRGRGLRAYLNGIAASPVHGALSGSPAIDRRAGVRATDSLVIFALLLAPWLIFATLYFGSPLPGSIAAKGVAYQLPSTQALIAFLRTLVVPFSGVGSFDAVLGLLAIAAYTALFTIGALHAIHGDSRSWPLFGFAVVYVGAYIVANPLIFRWYVVPPLPIFLLGITLGWNAIVGAFKPPRVAATLFIAGAAVAVASAAGGWWISDHGSTAPSPRMAYIKLELTYLEAAEKLRGQVNRETVIAAGDIGAIGYATGAHIYDTLGLITPDAHRYYPVPPEAIVPGLPYAIPTQLVLDAQPDIIVIVEAYGRNTFLRDLEFQAQYELIETIVSEGTRDYNSEGMLIFSRIENAE